MGDEDVTWKIRVPVFFLGFHALYDHLGLSRYVDMREIGRAHV